MTSVLFDDKFHLLDFNFEESWKKIKLILDSIFLLEAGRRVIIGNSYDTYNEIHRLCLSCNGISLLKFTNYLHLYLSKHVTVISQELSNLSIGEFEQVYNSKWSKYESNMKYLNKLFTYYNKHILRVSLNTPILSDDTYVIKTLMSSDEILTDVWYNFVFDKHIEAMRELFYVAIDNFYGQNSTSTSGDTLRNIVCFLTACSIKNRSEVENILKGTLSHFIEKRRMEMHDKFDNTIDLPQYLENIVACIAKLFDILEIIFPFPGKNVDECISQINTIIPNETFHRCFSFNSDNLSQSNTCHFSSIIYKISERKEIMKSRLATLFNEFTNAGITKVFENCLTVDELIDQLIAKFNIYKEFIEINFSSSTSILSNLNNLSIEIVECLEKNDLFFKFLSHKIIKIIFEEERNQSINMEEQIHKYLKIYSIIENIENFNVELLKCFARRMIIKSFTSYNHEMLELVKSSMNDNLKVSLSRMQTDADNILKLCEQHKQECQTENKLYKGIISFSAMRMHLWLIEHHEIEMKLPKQIQDEFKQFKLFFCRKYPSRKLHLVQDEGFGEIIYVNRGKKYELTINPYQLSVIYIFNDCDSVTLSNASNFLNIPSYIILHNMMPFVEVGILTFSDNTYSINSEFTYEKETILMNLVGQSPKAPEIQEPLPLINPGRLFVDIHIFLQSAIMSILKIDRKLHIADIMLKIANNNKISSVVDQDKVVCQLNNLVDREFLSVYPQDTNIYHYND